MSKISIQIFIVCPLFFFFHCTNPSTNQSNQDNWHWNNYTNGNYITALAPQDDTLWVATTGGLAKLRLSTGNLLAFYNKVSQGLPDNHLTSLVLDQIRKGIWIGTSNNGLVFYSGENWETYNTSTSSLPHPAILSLAMDNSGTLIIGTDNGGLALFDQNGSWKVYTTKDNIPSNRIYAITVDKNQEIWIGTDEGLGRLENGVWRTYNTDNSDLPRNSVMSLQTDSADNIIIGTLGKGLAIFDQDKQWILHNAANSGGKIPDDNIIHISYQNQNNNLWVGTYGGAAQYSNGEWRAYTSQNTNDMPNDRVHTIIEDSQQDIWIGTEQGLLKLDYGLVNTSTVKLPSNNINTIAIDHEKNVWIGTSAGIALKKESNWLVYNPENSGLQAPVVNAITFAANYDTWVATGSFTNGNVAVLSGTSWTSYDTTNNHLPTLHVQYVFIDNHENSWIGTEDGLVKYDGSSWTTYNWENADLPMNGISVIAQDAKGDYWLGCSEYYHMNCEGVAHFVNGKTKTVYNSDNSELANDFIHALLVDNDDNKWIGTNGGGLAKLDASNTKWSIYNETTSSLPGNTVLALAMDDKGILWTGTDKGLALFNTDNHNWKLFDVANSGLPENRVQAIALDQSGNVWLGTENGLALLIVEENEFIRYH